MLPTLESKGDCTTIFDWINGYAKMKTRVSSVEATRTFLREWWGRGIQLRQRTVEWVTQQRRAVTMVSVGGGIVILAHADPCGWFTVYKKVRTSTREAVPWMLKWADVVC